MTIYIANAFSLNMLEPADYEVSLKVLDGPPIVGSDVTWAIGHADTSRIVAGQLEIEDPGAKRVNVELTPGDLLFVAQYSGPRLTEGATELPEGAKIQWWLVEVD